MSPMLPKGFTGLPRFSLHRRITVLVLLVTAIVVGTITSLSIPVELFPAGYTSPFMRVFVPWRDAPPKEVLEKIAEPTEEELNTVKGIDRITSVSFTGGANIFLRFKQGTDMDLAYREVRDRVERARRVYPDDADRVFTYKEDSSGIPVTVLGVAVDESVTDTYNLLQKQVVLPLERVDGVANVEVNGLEEKEILIELDRDRTEASGLNIYDLAMQLGQDSFTMASGHVYDGSRKLLLRSVARYDNIQELENRPVSENLVLSDIATITYGEPEKEYRVRAMSKPAYAVIVFKEGDANARDVAGRVREVFEAFEDNPNLAQSESVMLFDQGQVIEESLSTLLQSGAIGAMVAAFVLFFFLRRLRVTMVVNLSVPLSLLIATMIMGFAGETLNLLSLLSLMVCVGLLVDNSVVVAENIDRLHKAGVSRKDAAISGAGEIALAITLSTLTTVVVFLPVALVEGPAQFFLLRMAVPICVALLASLVVALVTIPLGVYLTLPDDRAEARTRRENSLYGKVVKSLVWQYNQTFGRLNRVYNRMLGFFLVRRLDLVLATLVLVALTAGVAKQEIRFVEVQENEQAGFEIDVEMPDNYTLEETAEWFLHAESLVESHAEELDLEGWFLFHDKTDGELQGWFKNPRTRKITPQQVTDRVVELLPETPGVELSTGNEQAVEDGRDQNIFQVVLNGEDHTILSDAADNLQDALLRVDGVVGVRRRSESSPNELGIMVDRARTTQFGVNPQTVAGVVGYALRGQSLPKYRDEGREIPVRVRYQEEDRSSLADLGSFLVPTDTGDFLPLSALTDVEMIQAPEYIVRRNKRVARSITLDLDPEQEKETRERLAGIIGDVDLPEGVTFSSRTAQAGLNEDLKGLFFALSISVVFIYLLMGLLFESFILPLSIIFTIPLAGLGVIWIHVFGGMDIDFLGAVGIVLLVGVVVNNGIVLIDYVNRLREDGVSRAEAILTAADRRFRPIMMTAITTVGGMVPLAISGRMDSGISYTSFALTLIGGMTTATLLTLLIVPVFYTFFDDIREAFGALLRRVVARGRKATEGAPQPATLK